MLGSLKAFAATAAVALADWITAGLSLPQDVTLEQALVSLVEWALIGGAVWLVPNLKRG